MINNFVRHSEFISESILTMDSDIRQNDDHSYKLLPFTHYAHNSVSFQILLIIVEGVLIHQTLLSKMM